MSRVELAKIRSLTFYDGELTKSRRGQPIPQLNCKGSACKLYQPEVVQCQSVPGGSGTDVDWKCHADLPEALRFGKIQVSCEGWSGPGDPYVLKGSCGLDYRLVHVPSSLRSDNTDWPLFGKSWSQDPLGVVFYVLWGTLLVYIVYSLIKACLRPSRSNSNRTNRPPRPPSPPRRGGFWSGNLGGNPDPPPPYYPKDPNPSNSNNGQGWRPGFWTGALVGGIANEFFNRRRRENPPPRAQQFRSYDWERPRASGSFFSSRPSRDSASEDSGEGPSNLGAMRQSTGYGSSVSR